MKKKLPIIAGGVLITLAVTVIVAFAVIYPPYKEKQDAEKFFEDVSSFQVLSDDFTTLLEAETIFETSEEEEDVLDSVENYSVEDFAPMVDNLDTFLTQLEGAKAPSEIEDNVDIAREIIEENREDIAKLSESMLYLTEIYEIFDSFSNTSTEFGSSSGNFDFETPEELEVAIAEYNVEIAAYDEVFTSLLTDLETVSVPENFSEFHQAFITDFTTLKTNFDAVIATSGELLDATLVFLRSPQGIEDLTRLQNSITAFENNTALQDLENQELTYEQFDVEELFEDLNAEELGEEIGQLLIEFKIIEDYRKEVLE